MKKSLLILGLILATLFITLVCRAQVGAGSLLNKIHSTNSIVGNGSNANPIQLENDIFSPGSNYYYGTNLSGYKGFYHLPDTLVLSKRINERWALGGNSVTAISKLGTKTNFDLPFITNNVERARLTTGGYFGIGTSAPLVSLDVVNSTPGFVGRFSNSASSSASQVIEFGFANNPPFNTVAHAMYGTNEKRIVMQSLTTNDQLMMSSLVTGFYGGPDFQILQALNGTPTGNILYYNKNSKSIVLNQGVSTGTIITNYPSGIASNTTAIDGRLTLGDATYVQAAPPTNGAIIKGTVGIGTTTPNVANALHVVGNIFATGTITSSDARIKRNFNSINNAIAFNKLLKLNPITYNLNWMAQAPDSNKITCGFTADNILTTIPEAVDSFNNAVDLIISKDQYNSLANQNKYSRKIDTIINADSSISLQYKLVMIKNFKTVNYNELLPFMVASTKHLATVTDTLKNGFVKYKATVGSYFASINDYMISATSGTITLPPAYIGKTFIIKRTPGSTSTITYKSITGVQVENASNVYALSATLTTTQVILVFNGTNYEIINR